MPLNLTALTKTPNFDSKDFSVLNNSDVFIVQWLFEEKTHNQNVSYISESITHYGYDKQTFLEHKIQWVDFIHPEDLQKVIKTFKEATHADQGEYTIIYRIKSFDSYCWVQDNATFYRDTETQTIYIQSIVVNINHTRNIKIELEQKNNYLNLLHKTAISLGERQDLKTILNTILNQLNQFSNNTDTHISLKNEDDSALKLVAGTGVFEAMVGNSWTRKGFGVIGKVWQSGQACFIDDYQNYKNRVIEAHTNDILSAACIPLVVNGQMLGMIGYNSKVQIKFTDEVKALHSQFAQLVSLALDNSQLVDKLNSKLDQQKLLEEQLRIEQSSLAHQVKFRTNLSELIEKTLANNQHFGKLSFYEMILESAMQSISGAEAGSLLVRYSDDNFHFASTINYDLEELKTVILQEQELHFESNWIDPIIQYNVDNPTLNDVKQKALNQNLNELQVTLTIPIHINHQLIALINIDNFSNREVFTEEAIHLAQVFSRHLAVLWRRFKLEEELQERELQYKELFNEATQKTNELSLLGELQHAISNQLELDQLFNVSLQKIIDIFNYSFAHIRIREGNYLNLVAQKGCKEGDFSQKVSLDDVAAKQLSQGKPYVLINSQNASDYFPKDKKMPMQSLLLVPLYANKSFFGILGLGNENSDLGEKDLRTNLKVADLMSVAIENAQLHAHVKHDLRRNESLHKISQAVQDYDNLNELMDSIVEQVRQAINARWAIMYKIDIEEKCIKSVSTTNLQTSPLKILNYDELMNGLDGWSIRNKKVAFTPKGVLDKRQPPELSQKIIDVQLGSVAVIPFTHNGKVKGVFSVFNHIDDSDFSENDLKLLGTVANQVGAVIAKYELMRQIEHQAFHDSLTGLPNRLQFEKEIISVINIAQRRKLQFAILFIDLDGFKHINDTLGHALGDKLLIAVANRIQGRKRSEDTLARMGGDEFAIVLPGVSGVKNALKLANDYFRFFLEPYAIAGYELSVGASIGVSLYPDDGEDIHTLLSNADSAMYQAKNAGKNSVSGFTQSLAEEVKERAKLERELKLAIERDELELHYQPQYVINTQEIIGFEALVRWRHPKKGLVSPEIFIPIAEESNLIVDIGNWVLYEACRQNSEWQTKGHQALRIAVNISAKQFVRDDFVDTVTDALKKSHLLSEYLELEVTESVVMNDMETVIKRLKLLQKLNINIAIDDFGTGYSSLTYLQDLPLDKLKIDKSFVDKLEETANPAIIKTILMLAQSLGLTTIAEGVETKEQLQILQDLGCDEAQGFYLSKPLEKQEVFKNTLVVQQGDIPNRNVTTSETTFSKKATIST